MCQDTLTREDHAIIFKGYDLRIPLQLHGIFSYFVTRKPDVESLEDAHQPLSYATEIYTLTPTRWNPHTDVYALNEESIVDWEGNIKDRSHCDVKIVLDEIGDEYQGLYKVSSMEAQYVDDILKIRSQQNDNNNVFKTSELSTISSVLRRHLLTLMIETRINLGSDVINIGTMNCYEESYLDNGDDAIVEDETPTMMDIIQDAMNALRSEEDMDGFFASGVHGGPEVGIDAKHLSKVWQISYEDTKCTIDATTQHGTHHPNPVMNQNYTTNDRMLQYRRINKYFFMDTSFATMKGGTSSRGNTCCQLIDTDKGFIYVVPMKCKSEVLSAIKQFAKEVGVPDAIVSDMSREQVSQDVQHFATQLVLCYKL